MRDTLGAIDVPVASLDDLTLTTEMEKQDNEECLGFKLHGISRAPFFLALTSLFSPYLLHLARLAASPDDGRVSWFGIRILPTSYVGLYGTAAALIAAILAPILGAITDFSPNRKLYLRLASSAGALISFLSSAVYESTWQLGGLIVILSLIMYESSLVLIYAYLPEICHTNRARSRLSASTLQYSNICQVLIVLALSMLLSFEERHTQLIEGGVFEREIDSSLWEFRSNLTGFDVASSAPGANSSLTAGPLRSPVASGEFGTCADNGAPCALSQKVSAFSDAYQGTGWMYVSSSNAAPVSIFQRFNLPQNEDSRELMFSARIRHISSGSSRAQFRIWVEADNDSASPLVHLYSKSLDSSYSYLRKDITVDGGVRQMLFEIVLVGAGSFAVDDIDARMRVYSLVPISLAITSIWWFVLSNIAINQLHQRQPSRVVSPGHSRISTSLKHLFLTFRSVSSAPNMMAFLWATTFYSVGAATTISVISGYLYTRLEMSSAFIGLTLVAAQLCGAIGAFIAHRIGRKTGFSRALAYMYLLWFISVSLASLILDSSSSKAWLFLITPLMGISLGGSISLNRAVFAGMVLTGQEAEYFGVWHLSNKWLTWSGILIFTIVNEAANSQRLAIGLISFFFLAAFIIQFRVGRDSFIVRSNARPLASPSERTSSAKFRF